MLAYKDRVIIKAVNWLLQFTPKIKFSEAAWAVARYAVQVYHPLPNGMPDLSRPIPELSSESGNLVVDIGRIQVLKFILGISSPSALTSFPYMGVGSGAVPAVHTDDILHTELTGNPARLQLLNTNNVALSDSDIVSEVSGSFLWKCVAQVTYPAGDGNNGQSFSEFGIFSVSTFSPPGNMYNHFINPSPFTKSNALAVIVQITLRA